MTTIDFISIINLINEIIQRRNDGNIDNSDSEIDYDYIKEDYGENVIYVPAYVPIDSSHPKFDKYGDSIHEIRKEFKELYKFITEDKEFTINDNVKIVCEQLNQLFNNKYEIRLLIHRGGGRGGYNFGDEFDGIILKPNECEIN
jgi:hypothetical protein